MGLYLFVHNGERIKEEIDLYYTDGKDINYIKIGNMYNLFDYICYNINTDSKLKFINFTNNKLDSILRVIVSNKECNVTDYNEIKIKGNKKRIRGR